MACEDPEFSGVLATIFLCNDTELLAFHNGDIGAVKEYFTRLSELFSKVQNFQNIKVVILTTALFRQNDFLEQHYLRSKRNFNHNLLNSSDVEGCRIVVTQNGKAPQELKHVILDLDCVFSTSDMAQNKYYCSLEVPPINKNSMEAVHVNKFYMEKVLDNFWEMKKALEKSER